MAKTQYLKFKGLVAWARIWEGQEDEYGGKRFFKLNFYPTKEVAAAIKAAGIQTKLKDDDGEKSGVSGKYFSFRREVEREFNGEVHKLDPIKIYDVGGKKIEERVSIGNGSTIELTLEVYKTKQFGKGARINAVRILDLIEYNPPDDDQPPFDVDEEKEEIPVTEENGKKKIKW